MPKHLLADLDRLDFDEVVDRCRRVSEPFRVTDGKGFRLRDVDPDDTLGLRDDDKERSEAALAVGVRTLARLQDVLYAQDRWALLLVVQAMDAAGKDGVVKHVMSGVNPQGCQVHSFKVPSSEELDHDWMWRCVQRLPNRGNIGIFNRSWYEETLVVRVHPEILAGQKLPKSLVTDAIWAERFQDIRAFERYLARNGTVVRKFMLHVSKKEQRRRFLDRIADPDRRWKFALGDVKERGHWDAYMEAYEDAVRSTATEHAPWYVVPADHKWFTRLVVAAATIVTLADLDLAYPEVDAVKKRDLETARRLLAKKA